MPVRPAHAKRALAVDVGAAGRVVADSRLTRRVGAGAPRAGGGVGDAVVAVDGDLGDPGDADLPAAQLARIGRLDAEEAAGVLGREIGAEAMSVTSPIVPLAATVTPSSALPSAMGSPVSGSGS